MTLYLLQNPAPNNLDCYRSAVVQAATEEDARHIYPRKIPVPNDGSWDERDKVSWDEASSSWRNAMGRPVWPEDGWPRPEDVVVTRIGIASVLGRSLIPEGPQVLCADFRGAD